MKDLEAQKKTEGRRESMDRLQELDWNVASLLSNFLSLLPNHQANHIEKAGVLASTCET